MTDSMLGLMVLGIYLLCMVLLAQFKGDTSVGNFTWGGGVMLLALYTFFVMSSFLGQQILMTTILVIWALRLVALVYMRYTGKDPRFASWKLQGLKALAINIVWIFGQAIMIAIMSYPVVLVNTNNQIRGLSGLDCVGLIIWMIGFCYETIADYQLSAFMKNASNKGHVMRSGLWHYSRHPNYFGESLMWWGIYVMAVSLPYGTFAIITPVVITFLLVFVTGIPLIEKTMKNNAEYKEYQKTTSSFIPWFVKKDV